MLSGSLQLGDVQVISLQDRGATPEELAQRAMKKILYVGENVDPALRDQAEMFKEQIEKVLVYYMNAAIQSHNVTVKNRLKYLGMENMGFVLD